MRAGPQLFLRKLDFATLALHTFDASRPWRRLGTLVPFIVLFNVSATDMTWL